MEVTHSIRRLPHLKYEVFESSTMIQDKEYQIRSPIDVRCRNEAAYQALIIKTHEASLRSLRRDLIGDGVWSGDHNNIRWYK